MRTFDRLVQFDEKSRQYNARSLTAARQPRSYTWRCSAWLDQGVEGACVGFAWAHEAAARPDEQPNITDTVARLIYQEAQRLDPWEGEDYEGTSVLAGAKVLQRMGLIRQYRWAFTTLDALTVISRHGPAVIGVNWYEGMFEPDSGGFIRPTGLVLGGHAILVNGVNVKRQTVTLHNSWGQGWGVNGEAKMSWSDFDWLLQQQGEVCIPVLRS